MLQNLASYFLGGTTTSNNNNDNTEIAGGVIIGDNSSNNNNKIRTTDHDDGWTMVDCDSEGNSDGFSSEDDDDDDENIQDNGFKRVRLNRTSSNESLTHIRAHDHMEESWFVTPPPCFSSQTDGPPVHLRTSPLENLLIEHPSMSVYQRTGNRHPRLTSPSPSSNQSIHDDDIVEDDDDDDEDAVIVDAVLQINNNNNNNVAETMVVYRIQRNPTHRLTHLNEIQVAKNRQAQKVQIKKLSQQTARSYQKRANKAREVNGRNYNPRRKERSQGLNRSHASNNRKC